MRSVPTACSSMNATQLFVIRAGSMRNGASAPSQFSSTPFCGLSLAPGRRRVGVVAVGRRRPHRRRRASTVASAPEQSSSIPLLGISPAPGLMAALLSLQSAGGEEPSLSSSTGATVSQFDVDDVERVGRDRVGTRAAGDRVDDAVAGVDRVVVISAVELVGAGPPVMVSLPPSPRMRFAAAEPVRVSPCGLPSRFSTSAMTLSVPDGPSLMTPSIGHRRRDRCRTPRDRGRPPPLRTPPPCLGRSVSLPASPLRCRRGCRPIRVSSPAPPLIVDGWMTTPKLVTKFASVAVSLPPRRSKQDAGRRPCRHRRGLGPSPRPRSRSESGCRRVGTNSIDQALPAPCSPRPRGC